MEKVSFHNSKGLDLAGVLHSPENKTSSIAILSHGFTSSKDRERFVKLSEDLVKEGIAAFRFDFGGCGESEEREIMVKNQVEDLKSAIEFVKGRGYEKIVLVGESLGGLTSILSYNEDIKTLVLLAPVTDSDDKSKRELKNKLVDRVDDEGNMIHKKDNREFKISPEYFEERNLLNQREILSRIGCPALIIHGDNDDIIPLDKSKTAMDLLPSRSRLKIISEGKHTLKDHYDEVVDLCLKWIKEFV